MKIVKSANLLFGLSAGAVLITAGLLYLQNNSLNDLRGEVGTLRTQAESEKGASAKLLQAQRDLTALKSQLAHLEQGIPDAAYIPTMLKELEIIGKSQGVEMDGFRPALAKMATGGEKKPVDSRAYEPLDLEMKGKANYRDLLKFVAALNQFPKILEVRTITISPGAAGQQNAVGQLDITMGIRAFLFKAAGDPKKDGLST